MLSTEYLLYGMFEACSLISLHSFTFRFSLPLPSSSLPPPLFPSPSTPLGISHLNCPDSFPQCPMKQHLDPRIQGFFHHPASLPSSRSPMKTPDRSGNGEGAQGSATSLGLQYSVWTRTHPMDRLGCCGRGVSEAGLRRQGGKGRGMNTERE